MTDKVVGLDGRPIAPVEIKTDPVIIELLEGALIAAKQGHMSGLAIVTLMGDTTTCHTAFQCDLPRRVGRRPGIDRRPRFLRSDRVIPGSRFVMPH